MNDDNKRYDFSKFPYPIVCVIAFFLMGYLWDLWKIAWIVFLTIPVYYFIVSKDKRFIHAVPILCVIIFLALGFLFSAWNIAWLVFLTIPIFNFFFGPKKTDSSDKQIKNDKQEHQIQDSVYDMDK